MNPSDRELFLRWLGTSKEAILERRALGETPRYKGLLQDYTEDLLDLWGKVLSDREQERAIDECLRVWRQSAPRVDYARR